LRIVVNVRMIQRMRLKAVALFLTILLGSQLRASSDVETRGKDLIEQASAKMNIFELPSFRMNATVRIDNFGKPLDGTYSLLWNGPDQWREEITFPGYSEVQIGSKGTVYLKRTADFMPYRIWQLHAALGFGAESSVAGFFHLAPRKDEIAKSVHQEKLAGLVVECVKMAGQHRFDREVCIDQSAGVLNRQKAGYTDTEFLPVESKLFPRSMALGKDGKHLVEIHVTQLEAGKVFSPGVFAPPERAVSREGCMNPTPGVKTKDVTPAYPQMAKVALIQGTVATDTLIDTTGTLKNLHIVFTDSPLLNQATLDAVKQWRYEPATCDGHPVEVETVIEVHYTLR
jgi:TonB family protein